MPPLPENPGSGGVRSAVLDHADDGSENSATGAATDKLRDDATDVEIRHSFGSARRRIRRHLDTGDALNNLRQDYAANCADNRIARRAEAFGLDCSTSGIAAHCARNELNDDSNDIHFVVPHKCPKFRNTIRRLHLPER